MSAPPPYPGDVKGGPPPAGYNPQYPPPGQPGYPPPGQQLPPQGYAPPPTGAPPRQGYAQSPPPVGPVGGQQQYPQVVVAQPNTQVVMVQGFRDAPVPCQCPHCRQQIMTMIEHDTGTLTWLVAGALCIFGLWLGCCLIPFCIDGCKDVIHSCPNCHKVVHRYSRLN